ncbi:MAG: sugar ABC transporter permease [Fimbriimonadaceae bacterium]|nr:sugar ABC transporter permease [Fimbriimonadaceae bacterium]
MKVGRAGFIVSRLGPAVAIYAIFVLWPLVQSFQMSLFRWRGISKVRRFIGFENFTTLSTDPIFWRALGNTAIMVGIVSAVMIALSVWMAHLTGGNHPLQRWSRGIYLLPQVISLVAVALIWQFQLNPQYGLLTDILVRFGVAAREPGILRDPHLAFPAVMIAFIWHGLGFYVMLFGAGLKQIDQEVVEASALDGSANWHRFTRITWPLLWSVKRTALAYLLIQLLTVFALVFIMSEGGPDRATESLVSYLYEQITKNFQYGYASALAVILFFLSMLATGSVLFVYRRDPTAARGSR